MPEAGERLARLLKSRVVYHHSGLSYAARAGVIEPLAKAGQLRVVVATMGLAAGINFSLRSVALAGESYRRDMVEQPRRVAERMAEWFREGWCRNAIFNLKLPMKKRWDESRDCLQHFVDHAGRPLTVRAKQLYHDREEITVYAG